MIQLGGRCASCALGIDRGESDYFLGSYTINLTWALFATAGLAVAAIAIPVRPLLILCVGLPALAALAIWLHPVSRLVWLAIDLQVRPSGPAHPCAHDRRCASMPEDVGLVSTTSNLRHGGMP